METIGVLYVDSQNIGTGLSNTQIDALDTLASEAAMAIYNARLYKESQEKRKLDEQLAIAQEIQQALTTIDYLGARLVYVQHYGLADIAQDLEPIPDTAGGEPDSISVRGPTPVLRNLVYGEN